MCISHASCLIQTSLKHALFFVVSQAVKISDFTQNTHYMLSSTLSDGRILFDFSYKSYPFPFKIIRLNFYTIYYDLRKMATTLSWVCYLCCLWVRMTSGLFVFNSDPAVLCTFSHNINTFINLMFDGKVS